MMQFADHSLLLATFPKCHALCPSLLVPDRELRRRLSPNPHLPSAVTWLPLTHTVWDGEYKHQSVCTVWKTFDTRGKWCWWFIFNKSVLIFFPRTHRHDSFSNSEISLEQKSSDEAVKDIVPSPLYTDSSSSSISHPSPSPSLFLHGRLSNPPLSAPCASMALPSSSSSPLHHCATSVFQFDKLYSSASLEATSDRQTPPPLPPKPNHPSEQKSDESAHKPRPMSARHFSNHAALFPRRTSLSGLDHFRIGTSSTGEQSHKTQKLWPTQSAIILELLWWCSIRINVNNIWL